MSEISLGLSRPWDTYDTYLFDIDGTLLQCKDAVHYFAFCEALTRIAGRPLTLDGIVAHGNTDVGILRDALGMAGVAENSWRPLLPRIKGEIIAFVEANRAELSIQVLPGVREVLAHLRSRGAVLGVATGNLARVGQLKLEHCGLAGVFDFGSYSDSCEYRRDVFAEAMLRARDFSPDAKSVVVVGDTTADINAAHENGVEVIAVATGIFSRQQLLLHSPEMCVSSLDVLLRSSDPR